MQNRKETDICLSKFTYRYITQCRQTYVTSIFETFCEECLFIPNMFRLSYTEYTKRLRHASLLGCIMAALSSAASSDDR